MNDAPAPIPALPIEREETLAIMVALSDILFEVRLIRGMLEDEDEEEETEDEP